MGSVLPKKFISPLMVEEDDWNFDPDLAKIGVFLLPCLCHLKK